VREELARAIREVLEEGKAQAALFLVEKDGKLLPHLARDASDPAIEAAYAGDRRFAMSAFTAIALPGVEGKVAVVGRECDRRMMIELAKLNHLDLERVLLLGLPCSQELADACGCDHPVPPEPVAEPDVSPAPGPAREEGESEASTAGRLEYWLEHFSRCIRCYGCRNSCPLCICKECAIEREELVGTGSYPPDIPIFHIIRALDMADRCIDCGMCELSCPADIPLRELYRGVREVFKGVFGYEPGLSPEEKSPMAFLGEPADFGAHE
jgi:formate dehydrogenase subunit beta